MAKKKKNRRFYDYSLLFTIIFIMAFGLVMIYSASSYMAQLKYGDAAYFMMRQLKIGVAGLVVSLFGKVVNGKRRWLQLGPVSFQPTEFVKIALIVLLASVITQMGRKVNSWKAMAVVMGLAIPIAGIVAANNLSSGIIIVGIAFVMLFVACKKSWPFYLCGIGAVSSIFLAGPLASFLEATQILKPYQLERIHVWLEPEAYKLDGGFQVLQGLYAIGSGGLVGKGLGESIQKMGFVPEAQNDMIFSIICEELGLFGAVSVILIFLFMIYRFMVIAFNAPDLFGALIVVGVMAHVAIQVILNIAVVTNTIPNTGITLPFISYGGTSVLFLMVEMGMVLSVSNQIKMEK